jgi:hypothetical protein
MLSARDYIDGRTFEATDVQRLGQAFHAWAADYQRYLQTSGAHTLEHARSIQAAHVAEVPEGCEAAYVDLITRALELPGFGVDASTQIEHCLAIDTDGLPCAQDAENGLLHATIDSYSIRGAGGDECSVYDWKTGYKKPATDDLQQDTQARAYALLLFSWYGSIETVSFSAYYFRYCRAWTAEFTRDDVPELLEQFRSMRARIDAGPWDASPSPANCAFCGRRYDCTARVWPGVTAVDRYKAAVAELEIWEPAARAEIEAAGHAIAGVGFNASESRAVKDVAAAVKVLRSKGVDRERIFKALSLSPTNAAKLGVPEDQISTKARQTFGLVKGE